MVKTMFRSTRRAALTTMLAFGLLVHATVSDAAPTPVAASRKILVFGGSGQLGAQIVRALQGAGHDVTVFVRPTSDRDRLTKVDVHFIEGDVTIEADVRRAMQSTRFDVVVDALGRSGADVDFFATSGTHIAKWAGATGVKQLILHSSVGVGLSKDAYPPERYPAMRRLFVAKEIGENAAIASGVSYTIIRNAVLRDPPEGTPENARLVSDQKSYGSVSRRGLARLTLACIDAADCRNRVFHAIDDTLPVLR